MHHKPQNSLTSNQPSGRVAYLIPLPKEGRNPRSFSAFLKQVG